MPSEPVTVGAFDSAAAPAEDFRRLNELHNALLAERLPEERPAGVEQTARDYQIPKPREERHFWVAWDTTTGTAVGVGRIWVCLDPEHRHLAGFHIEVLPEHRRQGIGTQLLAKIAQVAVETQRSALTAWTYVAAGEPFMQRIGAQIGQAERISQLELAELDRDLVRAWIERAGGFRIELWEGAYPERCLDEAAAMLGAMNSAPRGSMPQRDTVYTAEDLRREDAAMRARGQERLTLVARDATTQSIVGFTQIFRDPADPDVLEQGDTGVFAPFRNRGIGRWLKAAMLEACLRRYPEALRIRTSNADSNRAMLKINTELGFRFRHAVTGWHITVEQLLAYLNAAADHLA